MGVKRPVRRADNLTTSDCLEIWEPQPPGRMRRAESRMEKPERSNSLGKSRRRWKYNIKVFIFNKHYGARRGEGDVDWIGVLQDKDK